MFTMKLEFDQDKLAKDPELDYGACKWNGLIRFVKIRILSK